MDLSICNSCASKNLRNQKLILCAVFALVISLMILESQNRITSQHKSFVKQIEALQYKNDKQLSELVKQERDILIYRKELASRSYLINMSTEEFLSIMTDYLNKDGRCEVHINKIDWSSWDTTYYKSLNGLN